MTDLNELLRLMTRQHASDLFLSCGAAPHLKIDGNTVPVSGPVLRPGEVRAMAYGIMNDRQKAAFEKSLEANLPLDIHGLARFRVNAYYQRGEVALAVRRISARIPGFEELGLPPECREFAMLKRGLVLFVGPAGSGKSTSLAAMIDYRAAQAGGHILTIEDPIEYVLAHRKAMVDQREVGTDTLSFGDALRNAVREAPDVIMIGEIRDPETARHAISYSESGHLCLSTLHASNAYQALERLLSFFAGHEHKQVLLDLSLNLKAIVSQRLIPALDGKLALATDVLRVTPYAASLIESGRLEELRTAMGRGGEMGMHTFDQSLFELYRAQRIGLQEALQHADSHADLALRIRLAERHTVDEAPPLTVAPTEPHHAGRK